MTATKHSSLLFACLVPHSAELVFMDDSGNMDRQNTRVFLLMTHSAAGGLPFGVLILSNEQRATITAALQLYLMTVALEAEVQQDLPSS